MEIYEDWLDCIHVVHLPPVTDSKLEVKPPLMSPPPPPKKGGGGLLQDQIACLFLFQIQD